MRLILSHENADFDAVASQLAASKLNPDGVMLLSRRLNRNVAQFLTLYWDAFQFIRPSEWRKQPVKEVLLVDTQALNAVRGMVAKPNVQVIDHHTEQTPPEDWTALIEPVGATTTLLVEQMQAQGLTLSPEEATLLQLGIYEDTGSLSYDTTTPRDAAAAAWLLEQGAVLAIVRRFLNIPLSPAQQVVAQLPQAVRPLVRVADLMSFGVQTLVPEMKVAEAAVLIQRLGHEGYPVVAEPSGRLLGLLTRRAVDRAMGHKMAALAIERIMKKGVVTVRPSDAIDTVQQLMLRHGWGQIPVLPEEADGQAMHPIGIVTRTDLLNHLFHPPSKTGDAATEMRRLMLETFPPALWQMVLAMSETAAQLSLPLYFVGGLVRDLLLGKSPTDLDVVVEGDAIRLGKLLVRQFGGDIRSHKQFGTAKWLLNGDVWLAILQRDHEVAEKSWPDLADMMLPSSIDFVTARTEFYTEPTALPEVKHGSIKLDLHRRDFAINTLAIRLDGAFLGQLLDFYGGQQDLADGLIRVLHSLSFVDDPTRILRAVRLEQRLGFTIESRTLELIDNALPLLARVSGARLRHEIELALQESVPTAVFARLAALRVLPHIYEGLDWLPETAVFFEKLPQFWQQPLWTDQLKETLFVTFALWLATLPEAVCLGVMKRLRVRKATKVDVLACRQLHEEWLNLPAKPKPSEVATLLRPFPVRVLLVGRILLDEHATANLIERFLQAWRGVKTAVSGDDLRQMGLKPGPQFTVLLEKVLAAKLDGEVRSEAEERALLAALVSESGKAV